MTPKLVVLIPLLVATTAFAPDAEGAGRHRDSAAVASAATTASAAPAVVPRAKTALEGLCELEKAPDGKAACWLRTSDGKRYQLTGRKALKRLMREGVGKPVRIWGKASTGKDGRLLLEIRRFQLDRPAAPQTPDGPAK